MKGSSCPSLQNLWTLLRRGLRGDLLSTWKDAMSAAGVWSLRLLRDMAAGAWITHSGLTTHMGNEQGGSVEGSPRWLFYLQGKPIRTEPHASFLLLPT